MIDNKYIYVDADSIHSHIRRIILNAALKTGIKTIFVADRELPYVKKFCEKNNCQNIYSVLVPSGLNSADNYISSKADEILICITHDVPLSALLAEKNISSIDERGNVFNKDNARERLSIRNFGENLRREGVFTTSSLPISQKDAEKFANSLWKFIRQ